MTPARQLITDYVLEHSAKEPLSLRMSLYRAIAADLPADAPEFHQLTDMADELEAIERRHQQLLLNFKGGRG